MAGVTPAVPARAVRERQAKSAAARTRVRLILFAWLPIIGLLVAWEAVARSGMVTPFALPTFTSCIERIVRDGTTGDLWINVALTLYRTFFGFAIAAVVGIAIGVSTARRPLARWFFDPIISVGFPMPKIAFLPIVVLWLGFHDASKITLVAFSTVFPVITTTMLAVQGVEKELIWSARSLGTSERQMLWEVVLPASLPQVLTGLQVALPIAFIVCIITEMAMSGYGIGGAMETAARFANSRSVFAGIIEATIIGYAMVKGMAIVRRRLLVWHQEANTPSTT